MTALLSFVLVGFIAFVIDGTGMIHDKIRMTLGLEQASLFLTAENNHFRDEKTIYSLTKQKNRLDKMSDQEKTALNKNFQEQFKNHKQINVNETASFHQYLRNIEIISGIVRSYYQPYQANTSPLADNYSYICNNEQSRIYCTANANFERPSWMYFGEDFKNTFGTFDKNTTVAANTIYAQKRKEGKATITSEFSPIDVMVVLDNSYSMDKKTSDTDSELRINKAKRALTEIAREVVGSESNSEAKKYNRLGFVSFALGAQQKGNINECVLPFIFITKPEKVQRFYNTVIAQGTRGNYYVLDWTKNLLGYDYAAERAADIYTTSSIIKGEHNENWEYFDEAVDYNETLKMIDNFTGENIPHRNDMIFFNKNNLCLLGGNKYTGRQHGETGNTNRSVRNATNYWYTTSSYDKLRQDIVNLRPGGATITSSGLIVGANGLAEINHELKNKKVNPQKILIVISDGFDAVWKEMNITKNLINPSKYASNKLRLDRNQLGICDRIRKRLDQRLTNINEKAVPSKIVYISYDPPAGETPSPDLYQAWEFCVGKDNFYQASNYEQLLEALKNAVKPTQQVEIKTEIEEVGSLITQ